MKIRKLFKNHNRFATYFNDHKDEIRETNLKVLKQAILFVAALFLLLFLFSPLLSDKWRALGSFSWMELFLAAFATAVWTIPRRVSLDRYGQAVCLIFYLLFSLIVIRIDLFSGPNRTATFFPVIIAILPIVFIFRMQTYLVLTFFLETCFILGVLHYKQPDVWQTDILDSLVGTYFAMVAAWIALGIRSREGREKTDLKKLSTIDYLTGILNKSNCEREVTEYLKIKPPNSTSALFVIDLDDFKRVNDNLGHQTGDQVLATMGELLSHTFRTTDVVGRIGGDEFMVLLRNIHDLRLVDWKSRQILEKVKNIALADGSRLSCSIGVAVVKDDEMTFEKLYQMADDALYEAKSFGKNRYVLYRTQEIQAENADNIMMIVDDSEIDREVLKATFEGDFEIMEAVNGSEAFGILSQYHDKISIVLLDVLMPEIDGYEVLRYMKSRMNYEKIPVIVISADKSNEKQALTLGAYDMIVKPVDPAITRLRVMNALNAVTRAYHN